MATKKDKPAGLSPEEKAALKAHMAELRAEKSKAAKADPEGAFNAAIEALTEPDKSLAKSVDVLVRAAAPTLMPKTFYAMPAWADKSGKIVCFFQASSKFKTRYSTFGFQDAASLDEGTFWPTAYALTALTPAVEKQLGDLLRRATGASPRS